MQRADMAKTQPPEGFGKIIEGPRPKGAAADRFGGTADTAAEAPRDVDRRDRPGHPRDDAPAAGEPRREYRGGLPARRPGPEKPRSWTARVSPGAWASLIAGLWVLGGLAVLMTLQGRGDLFSLSVSDWVMLGLALTVPLIVLSLVVQVIARAGDLRRAALFLARLATRLTEPDRTAADQVSTLGASIRAELDRVTDSLDQAVARVATLETMLQEQTRSIDRTADRVDERARAVGDVLDTQRAKLDAAAKDLTADARTVCETIDARASAITTAATTASEQLKTVQAGLEERTRGLDAAAIHAVRRTHEATKGLDDQTRRLEGITDAALEKAEMITAKYAVQHRALSEAAADLSRENAHLDKVLETQRRTLARIAETIEGQAKSIEDTVSSCVRDLDTAMDGAEQKSLEISGAFMERVERIARAGDFAAGAVTKAADLARDAAEKAKGGLAAQAGEARDALETQMQQARQALAALCAESGEAVERQSQTSAAGLGDHLTRIKATIDAQVGEARATFDKLETDLGAALMRNMKVIDGAVSDAEARLDTAGERVLEKVQRLSGETTQSVESLRQAADDLAKRLDDLPTQADESGAKIRAAIDAQVQDLTRIADAAAEKAREMGEAARASEALVQTPAQSPAPDWDTVSWDDARGLEPGRGPRRPVDLSPTEDLARSVAPRLRPLDVETPQEPPAERRPQDREAHPSSSGLGWREILKNAEAASAATGAERREAQDESDVARASLRVVETLQAMAIDLDRALEEDPPADLLQRYLSGERNVFARRLTLLGGPELAERIRRKYGTEPEFRHDVNRYIGEFESLMDTVTKGDRENILAQTYLTSQTGKVYLMLVNAIGRRG